MKEAVLLQEIQQSVYNWADMFDIDIEQDDAYLGCSHFNVIMTHKYIGKPLKFEARVFDSGECEMLFGEEDWNDIDMGNMFALLWFNEAEKRD